MADKVVDASVFAAITFAEPDKPKFERLLAGHRLLAPTLVSYEMTSVCLKKIRAHPDQRDAFLEAFSKWCSTAIDLLDVPHEQAVIIAERTRLTAFDACYLWLSRRVGAELVTRDGRLARAADKIF